VQRLARQLLADAKARPALIHRSETGSGVTKVRSNGPFPAMALLSDPALDIRQYLENLVRIAVDSAQQAEEMSFETRKANRKARRSMAVVTSFGALGLMVGAAAFVVSRGANVRLSEFRDEVSTGQNITSQQQRKEEALAHQKADKQAMREALQQQIADLQQQAKSLQDEVARRSRDLEAANAGTDMLRPNPEASSPAMPPAQEAAAADQPRERPALKRQAADLRQPASSLQDQVARRSRDLEAANTETDTLRQNPEAARVQTGQIRQDTGPLQQQRKAEPGTFAPQKRHEQPMAVLSSRLLSEPPLNPVPSATRPIPVFMPGLRASQQLLIAREWLVTGRVDQARRVLAIVQTQMVFHPVESDQPTVQGVNALATDVGNAIRWLDMGANGQAMQALNQALHKAKCQLD
jgi:hypothetical protein